MRLKTLVILLVGFLLINQAIAQQPIEELQPTVNKEVKNGMRIILSTSGPAKFSSHWLDGPPRLIVKFESKNIISKLEKELIVNQGVIKKITSGYFGRGRKRALKLLVFELTQKVPYKIWQENNTILLDIQSSLDSPVLSADTERIFTETEADDAMVKKLEAMDLALMQVAESQTPLESEFLMEQTPSKAGEPTIEVAEEAKEKVGKSHTSEILLQDTTAGARQHSKVASLHKVSKQRRVKAVMAGFFIGLTLISGLGFLIWRRYRLKIAKKMQKLKLTLDEKDKRLEHEKVIRKAVEETSLQREKEYQQLKATLLEKGLLKEVLSPEEKERPWISGKSEERRSFPRLILSRDYSRTIILRIESQSKPESIKSFANNVSSDGLSFETKEELNKRDPINLRLFFYGDIVPIIKVQAHIKWKREVKPINYYGVSFDTLEEKDKSELTRFIESKIAEPPREKA